ncbi:MAG: nitroreductase family protein [Anaerolineae bacterium]|nr:nitroreductase family protein [Anaerolineae bacterium]
MNEKITWLTTRRSIRRYQPTPISDDLITQLLVAATWAPSAHNRQPWRFAVIQNEAVKQQLALDMGKKLRTDLKADNVPNDIIEKDANRSYQRITQAPLLILLSLSMSDMDSYPDANRQRNEWLMAAQSTAMAGQNLLLAAHALGLGACWLCAPLFCPEVVKTSLSLPADWQPQALLTVGYPAEQKEKTRHSVESRTLYFR